LGWRKGSESVEQGKVSLMCLYQGVVCCMCWGLFILKIQWGLTKSKSHFPNKLKVFGFSIHEDITMEEEEELLIHDDIEDSTTKVSSASPSVSLNFHFRATRCHVGGCVSVVWCLGVRKERIKKKDE